MTPFSALFIGVLAGLATRDARRARLAAVPPWLAVFAAQTWGLGSGHGDNPSSTIANPGYWVFHVVVLVVLVGIAGGVGSLYRATPTDRPLVGIRHELLATVAAGGVSLTVFLTLHSPSLNGHGDGRPPVMGLIGLAACLVTVLALGAARVLANRGRVSTRPANPTNHPVSSGRLDPGRVGVGGPMATGGVGELGSARE